MVTSSDITAIQQRAIKAGGVLTETISDNLGGGYVIQGYLLFIYIICKFITIKKKIYLNDFMIFYLNKIFICYSAFAVSHTKSLDNLII